ncbi:helix-turn-helix domain-containing protein [Cellulomonas endophytica]|uniref:helix-turn-helix domain-containing protein n=1 Tax=Cellulomonas endophytica TaxID=2494735 RepID=UPI00101180D8|nr:helix-turn-helix domain-containing protein [Cellulomonas endophytica]
MDEPADARTGDGPARTRFLTVQEVAETMRVSKMTVYRLLHAGEMPGVRVGRSFRVPQDALERFLATSPAARPEDGGTRAAGRLSS